MPITPTIYPATMYKTVNGERCYVYPKTSTDLVKRGNITLEQALTNIETEIENFTGDPATSSVAGIVQIGNNINVDNGVISVNTGSTSQLGVLQVGTNINVSSGVISVNTASTSQSGVVQLSNAKNSSSETTAASSKAVNDLRNEILGLAVGDSINTNFDTLKEIADWLSTPEQTSAATIVSEIAAIQSDLGTASVGSTQATGLHATVENISSVLTNINNTYIAETDYATATLAGIVQIGSNINVTNTGIISVNTGSASQLGVVKVGTNINASSGTISVNTGSTTQLGLVKVGSNINVTDGTISVNTGTVDTAGIVQLNNAVNSTSTTTAATANAVKTAYDQAVLVMSGATSSADGATGRVPQPLKGDQTKYLKGDGTWDTPYTHPTYTAQTGIATSNQTPSFGGTFNIDQYKSDTLGHISERITRTVKIPDTSATASSKGLVQVGTNINVSSGTISVNTGSAAQLGVLKVGSNIDVEDGTISIKTASAAQLGLVQVGTNINVSSGTISVNTATDKQLGLVQVGTNINIASGVISVNTASTSVAGIVQLNNAVNSTSTTTAATANAVKTAYDQAVLVMSGASASANGSTGRVPQPVIGDQVKYLKGDGTWDTPYTHPTYTAQTGIATSNQTPGFGATFNIDQYSSDTLGHISGRVTRTVKIPDTVATASAKGLVQIGTNIDVSSGTISVKTADTSNLGLVKIGTNINVTSGTISVNTATNAQLGLVQAGTNINIASGIISVNTASASQLGLVKVGTNINVNDGTISVNTGSTSVAGIVQLNNAVNSTSTTTAATANAVKTAYDQAVLVMSGASASANGSTGRVPQPVMGDQIKFLRGDGTWSAVGGSVTVNNPEYIYFITGDSSEEGLMSISEDGNVTFAGEIFSKTIDKINERLNWIEAHI